MRVCQASTSTVKVERSRGTAQELERDAEQLMARILHSGLERALAANAAAADDPAVHRQRLTAGLEASRSEGTRSIDSGVWTRVLERDFGDLEYSVEVKGRPAIFWWDKSLTARVHSGELPTASARIDVDAYSKALAT